MTSLAINIMSYNRPKYLEQVLLGLKQNNLTDSTVRLFQDGIQNPFSGVIYNTQETINSCLDIFNSIFPNGQTFLSYSNLGVGLQYHRADMQSFVLEDFNAALYIEDDFVPGPEARPQSGRRFFRVLPGHARSRGRSAFPRGWTSRDCPRGIPAS